MKIAACVPYYRDVKGEFAQSLCAMLLATMAAEVKGPDGALKLELRPILRSSSVLIQAREGVVTEALAWGAEWLLLADSDHVFPPDALLRLLAHGKPLVGCNYMRRGKGGPVVAVGEGLTEVDHLGLGFMLVHRQVFEAMAADARAKGRKSPLPLFEFTRTDDGGIIGEDVNFCRRVRSLGFEVWCDHALSMAVGHIAEKVLLLRD